MFTSHETIFCFRVQGLLGHAGKPHAHAQSEQIVHKLCKGNAFSGAFPAQRHVSKLNLFNLLSDSLYFGSVVYIEALISQIELVHDGCNCNLEFPLGPLPVL